MGKILVRCTVTLVAGLVAVTAAAQDPVPSEEGLKNAFPEQSSYSPYANRNFPTQVFWGDTHLHTSYSTDAGMMGNRLGPEEAYRFARGEEVRPGGGLLGALGAGRAAAEERLDVLRLALEHARTHGGGGGPFRRIDAGEGSEVARDHGLFEGFRHVPAGVFDKRDEIVSHGAFDGILKIDNARRLVTEI